MKRGREKKFNHAVEKYNAPNKSLDERELDWQDEEDSWHHADEQDKIPEEA